MKLAPIIFSLMLALFAFQATGAFELVAGSCAQRCSDDDARGRCADTCTDCACCFHPRPTARTETFQPASPVAGARVVFDLPARYPSAPPGDILHVPIALLA